MLKFLMTVVTVVCVIVELGLGLVVNTVSVASQQRLLRYIKTSLVVAGSSVNRHRFGCLSDNYISRFQLLCC